MNITTQKEKIEYVFMAVAFVGIIWVLMTSFSEVITGELVKPDFPVTIVAE